MTPADHLAYALLWLSFGIGHSLLAGANKNRGLGRLFGRWHRIVYNGIALAHIGAIYLIGRLYLAVDTQPWPLPQSVSWMLDAAVAIGGIVIIAATGGYRLASFAGWEQLSGIEEDADQRLRISGLNRFVRHPLYTGALMILWGGVRSDFGLATALWGTTYILIGSKIEEQRLSMRFGQDYADYRRRVPALVPWRGFSAR
jgi:protein-S-isoprenylcysteine O-methyltransferase Ste14